MFKDVWAEVIIKTCGSSRRGSVLFEGKTMLVIASFTLRKEPYG